MDSLTLFFTHSTAFASISWQMLVMWAVCGVLFYLAIVKQFEPLLLLPIAFGAFVANLPTISTYTPALHAWKDMKEFAAIAVQQFGGEHPAIEIPGLYDILSLGIKLEIFPPIIFLGVGALTDFGPVIANPKTFLLGAAAQGGVLITFFCAFLMGFRSEEAASIAIIGGADGPTAIFLTNNLAPHLLGAIAVAAYSYMALVPLIQPPIMKLLTNKAERKIRMKSLRPVGKLERIVFALVAMTLCILLVPPVSPLMSMLFLGNILRESGVVERLTKASQNEIINIVTIFLGTSVGITMAGENFLRPQTLMIIALGVVAFGVSTATGVVMAKFMNLFLKEKMNPLIGSAGVSAVPMAARVSQVVGQKEDPQNFLLMHAMGPNVAGVIGTAVVAGFYLAMLKG